MGILQDFDIRLLKVMAVKYFPLKNHGNMPINILELLEKRTRLHGGKEYLTTVRVIAGCNGSFFDGVKYSLGCTLTISGRG